MQANLHAIALAFNSPDAAQRGQAEEMMESILNDPTCASLLLNAMQDPATSREARELSRTFLPRCIVNIQDSLSPEDGQRITDQIIANAIAARDENDISALTETFERLMDVVGGNWDRAVTERIFPVWNSDANPVAAICLLHMAMKHMSKEILMACSGQIRVMIERAMTNTVWRAKIAGVNVFFSILPYWQGQDVSDLMKMMLLLTQATDFPNEDAPALLWAAIADAVSKGLISDDVMTVLFQNALVVASCPALTPYLRYMPLHGIHGSLPRFNLQQFTSVIDVTFQIARDHIAKECSMPDEMMRPLATSLQRLPEDEIYAVIKPRIGHLLASGWESQVVAVCALTGVLFHAPDVAYKDATFIMGVLLTALDQDVPLLRQAVCEALKGFDESFISIATFIPAFMPKVIPLIMDTDEDLRATAMDGLHTIFGMLDDVCVEGVFEALWKIKDHVDPAQFDAFVPFLAYAVEYSADFGDTEMKILIDYVSGFFMPVRDPEMAASILPLVDAIITHTYAHADHLLPLAVPFCENVFRDVSAVSSAALQNVFAHIQVMFHVFPANAGDRYGPFIPLIVRIALNQDNVFPKSDLVVIKAFECCCTIAKATKNVALAMEVQELCTRNLSGYDDDDDDGEEDDDDGTRDDKCFTAMSKIVKLLDPPSARQLFENLLLYVQNEQDPGSVGKAFKPMEGLLSSAGEENRLVFLTKCYEVVNQFCEGELPCLCGCKPSEHVCDHFLVTAVCFLIAVLCRYPSPHIDRLCMFCLKSIPNSGALYSALGVCSDAIKYGTCSADVVTATLQAVQDSLGSGDPDVRQNIAFLMNVVIQKFPAKLSAVTEILPVLSGWFRDAMESPVGKRLMQANIASLILQYVASGGVLPDEFLLVGSLGQIPGYDKKETVPMIRNMLRIIDMGAISENVAKQAALSLGATIVLSDGAKVQRNVTPEVIAEVEKRFVAIVGAHVSIQDAIREKYGKSSPNSQRLMQALTGK